MQRILVGRWWFYLALLSFIVVWAVATVAGYMSELSTVHGYDPTPVLFLIPLGIVLSSYAVGGPLARRSRLSGLLVERWFFLVGVAGYVGAYAAAVLVGWQFNPSTGSGEYSFPVSLFFPIIILALGASFGRVPAAFVPSPELGPGGVPDEPPSPTVAPPPVPAIALAEAPARRLDRVVMVVTVVALALLFVLWTGYEPGVFGPNTVHWTLEYRECGSGGNSTTLPSSAHRFPLWARVHIVWAANEEADVYTFGPVGPYYDGLGESGNWSFISNAQPVVFVASPTFFVGCSNFTVQFESTVTV